ncbi:MAG: hypothetical protein QNJ67_05320 [Kiloniellales bacterium]|nr:hypothetical protein [Kiloniellales bacterium]
MRDRDVGQSPLWMGVLVAASILFSFALACGMPFAALGALGALTLVPRSAFLLAGLGWLANQMIGYGFLGYPLDAITLAWGVALGLSALAGVGAAILSLRLARKAGLALAIPVAFVASWAAQQGTVFAASLLLGATASAFAPAVLWFIFWTNAVAFAGLLAVQWMGGRIGLARPPLGQAAG